MKIKKAAKDTYKKIPKKEILNKAASLGIRQIVGGTYLDIISFLYKKTKKKAISYAGSYAYDSFLHSKFARDKINSLPMLIVSLIFRTVFGFLILSKLVTGIKILDFIISVTLTVIITLLSPFFYISIKAHEDLFLSYTDIFMSRLTGPQGLDYLNNTTDNLLYIGSIIVIVLLNFVNINSRYLQELIIHTIITKFISDTIQTWINKSKVSRCYYGMFNAESNGYVLSGLNYVQLYKRPSVCDTKNLVIIKGIKPQRAKIVFVSPKDTKNKESKEFTDYIDIIDDYNPSIHSENLYL